MVFVVKEQTSPLAGKDIIYLPDGKGCDGNLFGMRIHGFSSCSSCVLINHFYNRVVSEEGLREQILQKSQKCNNDLFKSSPHNEGQVEGMPTPLDKMPQK